MSSSPADVSSLTEEQQASLQQYTSITNQDVEPAVGLLQRSQWNVQVRFF
jgi:FAS-associated factor 2